MSGVTFVSGRYQYDKRVNGKKFHINDFIKKSSEASLLISRALLWIMQREALTSEINILKTNCEYHSWFC